jgi:predicted transcriptional regulator
MKRAKVQNLRSLREEMKAVALLTPDNRRLLALIRDRKPESVAELVEMTGRAQPNLTRTLAKLEAAGFIRMKTVGRRKAPSVAVKKIIVEIDPYADRDRLRVA